MPRADFDDFAADGEVFIGAEEIGDAGKLGGGHIRHVADLGVGGVHGVDGHGEDFFVGFAAVDHGQHGHGAHADEGAGEDRAAGEDEHVEFVAVAAERAGQGAVIGGIGDGGGEEAINDDAAGGGLDLVFDVAAGGDLDPSEVAGGVVGRRSEEVGKGEERAAREGKEAHSGTVAGGVVEASAGRGARFGGNWAWWNDPASVGHLLNSSPHAIDLLRWFTGGDVVTASAFSRTLLPDVPVEDTTMGLLEFSTGAICSLFSSRALPAPSFPGEDFRFRITGSTGLLDLDPYGELRQSDDQGWRTVSQQPPVKHEAADAAFADVRMQAYCDQMSAFIAAIEGQPSNVGSAADGRAGVAACLAMLESSATRSWINLAARK